MPINNTSGKIYYIVPTSLGVDVPLSECNAASTTVMCPLKPFADHNGAADGNIVDPVAEADLTLTASIQQPYFTEVVGITPIRIVNSYTGTTAHSEQFLGSSSSYIKEINYKYLEGGGKAISIVYDQEKFQGSQSPKRIEFRILFENGDYHTVSQHIVRGSLCLDPETGIDLDLSQFFDFSDMNVNLPHGFTKISNKGTQKGGFRIKNANSPNLVTFNTYAYTDNKWGDMQTMIGSTENDDYFQICPLFQNVVGTYGDTGGTAEYPLFPGEILTGINAAYFPDFPVDTGGPYPINPLNGEELTYLEYGIYTTGDAPGAYLLSKARVHYEYRQTSRSNYHTGNALTEGTLGQEYINLFDDIIINDEINNSNNYANSGFVSLDWMSTNIACIAPDGIISLPPGGLPTEFEGASDGRTWSVYDAATRSARTGQEVPGQAGVFYENPFSNPNLGWTGTFTDNSTPPTTTKNTASAFHLNTNSASREQEHLTARRFDGVIFALSGYGTSTLAESPNSGNTYTTEDLEVFANYLQYADGMLANTDLAFPFEAGGPNGWVIDGAGSNVGDNYTEFGFAAQSHIAALRGHNMLSPQDYISNKILGRHSYFLDRPYAADTTVEHPIIHSILTGALFGYGRQANFSATETPSNTSPEGYDRIRPTSSEGILANTRASGSNATTSGGGNPDYATYGTPGDKQYRLVGLPFHVYVDGYEDIDTATPTNSGSGGRIPYQTITSQPIFAGGDVSDNTPYSQDSATTVEQTLLTRLLYGADPGIGIGYSDSLANFKTEGSSLSPNASWLYTPQATTTAGAGKIRLIRKSLFHPFVNNYRVSTLYAPVYVGNPSLVPIIGNDEVEISSLGNLYTSLFAGIPTLDKNTTFFQGGDSANDFDAREVLPVLGSVGTMEDIVNGTGTVPAVDFWEFFPEFEKIDYYYAKSFLCNNSVSQKVSPSDRRAYARGCINWGRSLDPAEAAYTLRLITHPSYQTSPSNSSTELVFESVYTAGLNFYLKDHMLPGYEGLTFTAGVLPSGTSVDCGCDNDGTNFAYEKNNSFISQSNDILETLYVPGRGVNEQFPITEPDSFSNYTMEILEGTDTISDDEVKIKFTASLIGNDPLVNDRIYADVQTNNFDWSDTTNFVSDLRFEVGNGGGNYSAIQRGLRSFSETDVSNTSGLDYQVFPFVGVGKTLVEGGGLQPELPGCTTPDAINYNPDAGIDDGSCISCDGVIDNLASGYSENSITPNLPITADTQPYGMGPYYNNGGYEGGTWHQGQIGNAFNHWGFGLTAANDYSSGSDGIVIPYGAAWDAAQGATDAAAPYTEFTFRGSLNASLIGNSTLQNWVLINKAQFNPLGITLRIYNIENWTGADGWATVYNNSADADPSENIPITDYDNPVLVMQNQSIGNPGDYSFATYDLTAVDAIGGVINYETYDILSDQYFQDKLKAGHHYIAVLEINVDTLINEASDATCNKVYAIPYNFWVMFCGCDIINSPTYVGNTISDFPWSSENPFPAGYSTISQCNAAGNRRIARANDTQSGYCAALPPEFQCDNFLDACVHTTSFNCVYTQISETNQTGIITGTAEITVFGALVPEGDSPGNYYSLLIANEIFTFNLYVVEGSWDVNTQGTPTAAQSLQVVTVSTIADYQDLGLTVADLYNGEPLHYTFELQAGTYSIILEQTNNFSFQNNQGAPVNCGPILVGEITAEVNGETECPDQIIGCTDPSALNYDCACGNFNVGGCDDDVQVAGDGCCIYIDCDNIYLNGSIGDVTTTPTVLNCSQVTDDQGDSVNVLTDTQVGVITVNDYDANISEIDGITVTGNFVMGIYAIYNAQAAAADANLLALVQQNLANTYDPDRTDPITATVDGVIVGMVMGFNADGTPVLTTDGYGLPAGSYIVSMFNSYDVDDSTCGTETGFIDNFDAVTFANIGSTANFDNCPSPCNDQANPDDCPDIVGGCTDENAVNFDPDADYNDGSCDYSTNDPCDQGEDEPGCEDCESAAASGLVTFRNCDEFNETTEGCCDPTACNYQPDVDTCLQSRCEYCCDGTEDCSDDNTSDECEDQDGNIIPDCVVNECPDPSNPACDEVIVDPCPGGDCGGPPVADCIVLGNCDDDTGGGDDDTVVIIDDPVINEVYCNPNLGSNSFQEVIRASMTCSAQEGSNLLFKMRSGVKYDKTDLIKLELINYLFSNAINNPCMSDCENTEDQRAIQKGINRSSCASRWEATGKEYWAKTSSYRKGTVVALLFNQGGKTRKRFYRATRTIGPGELRPDTRTYNTKTTGWITCVDTRGVLRATGDDPYVYKLYEFMTQYCEQCSIVPGARSTNYTPRKIEPGSYNKGSLNDFNGLVDENGNPITLF